MSNTTIPLQAIIFGHEAKTVMLLTAIQICFYRYGTCILICLRASYKYKAFLENYILVLFYFLLFCGNLLIATAQSYLAVKTNTPADFNFPEVLKVVNILTAVGVLCIDAFFGLVPNMFYSVSKTGLGSTEDQVTKVYFTANLVLTGLFCGVTLIFNFLGEQLRYVTDIIVMTEVVYGIFFYLFALRTFYRLGHGKLKRMLLKFFFYYLTYAIVQLIRYSLIIYSILVPPSPSHTGPMFGVLVMDATTNAVLTMSIMLFLKDFKLKSREERISSFSSSKSTTKDQVGHEV
eukprot:TRINITY_DN322_c0_g1_i1.p1 TRINITY_DN322_c0_g1~~TRINITY_DN322_c0_g1_i1.p1  ORF type:complete len:290 (-),score=44.63 TRINITY_DN322_c0_g1_i1:53-922(-)